MAFCLNQALRNQKYQQRRFQSTVVLCFERKSSFIIVAITYFLQNGKPHIYCRCKRVLLLPKILATKRERKADLPLRGWNSVRSICYKDSERKWINCGHLPKEISRVTKYIRPLDQGASRYCNLSSEHYPRPPYSVVLNCREGGGGVELKGGVAEISNFDKMGGSI